MKLQDLKKPLQIDEIDFRVQSINKGKYATILAYKDARIDMNRLDDVCGSLAWKREHTRDNQNCIVSIWDNEKSQWISKEDTGTESNTEKEKGLASDSFKRACFNWGIGRELYDYPVIQIKLRDDEVMEYQGKFRASYNLNLKKWHWFSQFVDGRISFLYCKDEKGTIRFRWGEYTKDMDTTSQNHNLKDECFNLLEMTGYDDDTKEKYKLLIQLADEDGLISLRDNFKSNQVDRIDNGMNYNQTDIKKKLNENG